MKKLPMRRIVSLPVLAAFVVLGASCSQQVQQPVKKAVPPPVYVGKVEQVYPNHHYVLIALAGNVYEPGTVLISQSPGREEKCRVANLIVTEERMGRARIPADIRSGAVEAGDLVFLYRNLAVPESTGKMDEQKPVSPEPETDEDSKVVAPPIAPDGGGRADASARGAACSGLCGSGADFPRAGENTPGVGKRSGQAGRTVEQDFLRKTGGKITGCGGIRHVSQGGKELLKMRPGIGNSDISFFETDG